MFRRDVLKLALAALVPLRLPATAAPVKVFAVGDYDYVAARSMGEAIEWYLRETGITPEEMGEVYEVGPNGMNTLKIIMDDYEDTGDEWTFREWLDLDLQSPDLKVPYLFSSSAG